MLYCRLFDSPYWSIIILNRCVSREIRYVFTVLVILPYWIWYILINEHDYTFVIYQLLLYMILSAALIEVIRQVHINYYRWLSFRSIRQHEIWIWSICPLAESDSTPYVRGNCHVSGSICGWYNCIFPYCYVGNQCNAVLTVLCLFQSTKLPRHQLSVRGPLYII